MIPPVYQTKQLLEIITFNSKNIKTNTPFVYNKLPSQSNHKCQREEEGMMPYSRKSSTMWMPSSWSTQMLTYLLIQHRPNKACHSEQEKQKHVENFPVRKPAGRYRWNYWTYFVHPNGTDCIRSDYVFYKKSLNLNLKKTSKLSCLLANTSDHYPISALFKVSCREHTAKTCPEKNY